MICKCGHNIVWHGVEPHGDNPPSFPCAKCSCFDWHPVTDPEAAVLTDPQPEQG